MLVCAGPKIGDDANDTGFMRLENVRVPLENMMAKYQEVTPEGKVPSIFKLSPL